MKLIKLSRVAQLILIVTALYWLCAFFVSGKTLIDIINGAFLGVSISLLVVYAPLFSYALVAKKIDRVSQLSLGIGFLVLSVIGQRGWSLYSRSHTMPERTVLFNNPFVGYIALLSVVGGVFLAVAPGFDAQASITGDVKKSRILVVAGLIVGAVASALFSYFQIEKS